MCNNTSPIAVAALLLGVLALAGPLVPSSARAAERIALVIGNASYKDAPLRNPVNDARAMAEALEDLGFDVIRVENADKEEIERAIGRFTARLDEESAGLFYYAGHGVQVRGRNYLVPVDAQINSERDARIESVPINLVLDELEYAGNRLNVVILDACRNNPFERRMRGASRGLAAVDAARGTLIAYATSPGSLAQDGDGRNGLYTEELLRALRLPGLEVEDVFKEVRIKVSKRTGHQQVPWESSSLTGKLVLNRRSPTAPQTSSTGYQNDAIFWEGVENSGTPEAYRLYLQKFPSGVFAELAALRIDELERKGKSSGDSPTTSGGGTSGTKLVDSNDSPPYNIVLFPPVEISFAGGTDVCVDEEIVTKEIRERIFASLAFTLNYNYDGEFNNYAYQRLRELAWRSEGIRALPDFEQIRKETQDLDADVALLYSYEPHGGYCSSVDFRIYLYDLKLQKMYTEVGSNHEVRALTDKLIGEYLSARPFAQESR